ncbi:esterase [Streptomyces sp. NPDC048045]|uniref:esterase n=1 Tax=Streptomyces sp. NPDC048045 TaxID=3154710 RepID=UPI0034477128
MPPHSAQPIHALWISDRDPAQLRPGSILLNWEPGVRDGMDVTARLGLASAEVLLASWPNLPGDWTPVVHPTVFEAIGLHAALSVATDALHLANHLASA